MELAYKLGTAALLTVIIIANIWERRTPQTPASRLLWGRFANLMLVGMGFLTLLVAFTLVEAFIMIGWAGPGALDTALPILGALIGALAIGVLVLAGWALVQLRREENAD